MKPSYAFTRFCLVCLAVLLVFSLSGCGGSSTGGNAPTTPAPLSAGNINLIFVVSPDLAYDPLGDINSSTANLSNKGLQRSLLMATYLKQQVMGTKNVTGIYVLEPMTHLQTVNKYPDMASIGFIQQFALLNQLTLPVNSTQYPLITYTANSYPLGASYAPGDVPSGVATPSPSYTPGCQGLAFNDAYGNNVALATRIINANVPGFYVFSAPWETTSALLANIKTTKGYNLNLPTTYMGPNFVYVITISPSGDAGLVTYNSNLIPPDTYPVLPSPVARSSSSPQTYFSYSRTETEGVNDVIIPPGTNINETVYLIRHAEAHPDPADSFEDGNYVGAGQWRALDLPNALRGKISPNMVYSIDPAQSFIVGNNVSFSYVRPSLTVLPYAIANKLPYYLVASFLIGADPTDQAAAKSTSDFFFKGGNLSNQTVLLAWEHEHFPPLIKYLIQSYGGSDPVPTLTWPPGDYDTIWTVKLDARGNLTVDNALFEGIDSTKLPATAPLF